MSIISQDPVLFDLTIRDNIAYAVCERQLSEEEIINAAKMANIHDFIMSLPKVLKKKQIIPKRTSCKLKFKL